MNRTNEPATVSATVSAKGRDIAAASADARRDDGESTVGIDGLLHAVLLDGAGGAATLDLAQLDVWSEADGILWVHLDYTVGSAREWLFAHAPEQHSFIEILLTDESRPRTSVVGDTALIALRGVNLHPEADPEDMVGLRFWVSSRRVITARRRRLLSVSDTRDALAQGQGPCDAADIVVTLADRLTRRMDGTIEDLQDRVAGIEEDALDSFNPKLRREISDIRRVTIMLRRYLSPQRDALSALAQERLSWVDATQRLRLREVLDRLVRHIEDLDSIRERAAVNQEELANRQAELMNGRMYVLSLVSAIFLPLGFLTGLLGVNVGGIPGSDSAYGFLVFGALVALIGGVLLWWFKRRRWF